MTPMPMGYGQEENGNRIPNAAQMFPYRANGIDGYIAASTFKNGVAIALSSYRSTAERGRISAMKTALVANMTKL